MFSSRFFWKLYLASVSLVLLTAAAVSTLALQQTERALLREREGRLRQLCVAMAPEVARAVGSDDDSIGQLVRRAGEELAARVTLIDAQGLALADSGEDVVDMDSHIDRPEVQEALVEGFGTAERASRTMGERMFYVAYRLQSGEGPSEVLRLSIPLSDIDKQLRGMRGRLLLVALLGVLGALGLGAYLAHRLTRPLAEITRAAASLRSGHYETRLSDLPGDEIGILGDALNQLGVEVTERIREATSEEDRLRAMVAGMVEGVVAVDEDDRVIFSNLAARELLDVDELQGTLLWETVRIAELDGLLREARSQPVAARRELIFGAAGRGEVVLRAQAHRFLAEGSVGVVVVLHDITELRRLERVRRDFVANVSHELKTPLTSIRGYVETLQDGAVDEEPVNRRFLDKIEDNVKRLNHLVSDLLSLARIEEQRDGLPLERLDLRPVLAQAILMRESAAAEKQIDCQLVGADHLLVLGDRESLVQVVDNLLDNAIKYTPRGGRIEVSGEPGDETVVLRVADTGIGIPPEDLERVFERFYRVDKARSREVGGTGLGLSIVKHLVGAMGGEVGVRSTVGEGTTFSVVLPAG